MGKPLCVHRDLLAGLASETNDLLKVLEPFPLSDEATYTINKLKALLEFCLLEGQATTKQTPYCEKTPNSASPALQTIVHKSNSFSKTHTHTLPTPPPPPPPSISAKKLLSREPCLATSLQDFNFKGQAGRLPCVREIKNEEVSGLDMASCIQETIANRANGSQSNVDLSKFTRRNSALTPIEMELTTPGALLTRESGKQVIKTLMSYKLEWRNPPSKVLIIKKWKNSLVSKLSLGLLEHLLTHHDIDIYLEAKVLEDEHHLFQAHESRLESGEPPNDLKAAGGRILKWNPGNEEVNKSLDFIICLGGDGTILYASSLFQKFMPPVMSFHFGTLGFLAPFKYVQFSPYVEDLLAGNLSVSFRSRFICKIHRKDGALSKRLLTPATTGSGINSTYQGNSDEFVILNEVAIGRGNSSYLGALELKVDGKFITRVQADGLIIATPTGSTAYSLSAGGPMVHPNVPGILLTPICPHSLSFRPIVIPDTSEVEIIMPVSNRVMQLWVCMDGRNTTTVYPGDKITISCSGFYIPQVMRSDQHTDWVESLTTCLSWNTRGHVHSKKDPFCTADSDHTSDTDEFLDLGQEKQTPYHNRFF